MAEIYTKSTTVGNENCVILEPRQALIYPFGPTIGSNWTKIRICMMMSHTSLSAGNANMDGFGSPSIVANNVRDRLYYGVKKIGSDFPAEVNQPFLGFRSYGANTSIDFPQTIFDQRNTYGSLIYLGVHHPNGNVEGKLYDPGPNQAYGLVFPPSSNDDLSGFAGAPVIAFEVINKGESNQKIIIRHGQTQITNSSQAGLRQHILNSDLNTSGLGTYNFNASGSPYDLPDSFFIYNPISTVRIRVFGLAVVKES